VISAVDLAVIVGVVAGAAILGVVLGRFGLQGVRGRSVRAAVVVVIATSASVMAVGVLLVGGLMLVSGHALLVLLVVVGMSAIAAAFVASDLSHRLARSGASLSDVVRRVGQGNAAADAPAPETRELRALAAELAAADVRLAEARVREAALEATRRELVAWVSHDLRSPLAGILAMSSALEDGVVTEAGDVADYHARIRRETQRLGRMVDDLFELSRISAGALQLTFDSVPLDELVGEVLEGAGPVAEAKRVHLLARAVGGPVAVGDAQQLARVVRNLVANALRHTPSDGTVTVECTVDSAGVPTVAVGDGCGGIPPQDLARLFDVGYRGEWARTPGDDAGAGLGLAIAKGIVEAHHGRISVENGATGCRFVVRLPLASSSAAG
jgi:signal transduction histidine kinase